MARNTHPAALKSETQHTRGEVTQSISLAQAQAHHAADSIANGQTLLTSAEG